MWVRLVLTLPWLTFLDMWMCVCVAGIDLGEYVDVCTCIYIYIYRYCMYWHACVNVSMHVYRRTRCRDCIP